MDTKPNRYWQQREITDRLQRERDWRKSDTKPVIGFREKDA